MCCSTGICGTSVDPALVRFAADLAWLKHQGVDVQRFNLSQEPAQFASDGAVKHALETMGEEALPLVKVNQTVMSSGRYPTRDELAVWAGISRDVTVALPRLETDPSQGTAPGPCCSAPRSNTTTSATEKHTSTCC